jgi:hypothetical protein
MGRYNSGFSEPSDFDQPVGGMQPLQAAARARLIAEAEALKEGLTANDDWPTSRGPGTDRCVLQSLLHLSPDLKWEHA